MRLHRRRHISLTFFTKCEWTQSLWLHRKRPKKRSWQARGNTNTKQKRKQTKTLRMISTAYNNVAACKNLWATIMFVVKRWKHSPEDYAYQNVRQRPSKVSRACYCCTDDDGATACLTSMHGLKSERGSEFLCERERRGPEWINSHQCTSWPFCPLDGLHFFIRHRMGFMTIHFFLLLTIVLLFFGSCSFFPKPDLTHSYPIHFSTLFTFLPSYCTHHLPY